MPANNSSNELPNTHHTTTTLEPGDIITVTTTPSRLDIADNTTCLVTDVTYTTPPDYIDGNPTFLYETLITLSTPTSGTQRVRLNSLEYTTPPARIPPTGTVTDDIIDALRTTIDTSFTFPIKLTTEDLCTQLDCSLPPDWPITDTITGVTPDNKLAVTTPTTTNEYDTTLLANYGADELISARTNPPYAFITLFSYHKLIGHIARTLKTVLPYQLYSRICEHTDFDTTTPVVNDVLIKTYCAFNIEAGARVTLPATGTRHRFAGTDRAITAPKPYDINPTTTIPLLHN